MRDLAIYGAGGLGREVACLIRRINEEHPTWNFIGFFDDNSALSGSVNEYGQVLGNIETINNWPSEIDVAVAIGNPLAVKKVVDKIANPLVSFPNLISPDVSFADRQSVIMGKGNIVQRQCTLSCNIVFGDFNFLNTGAGLGHDVRIDSYNSLMPFVRISGGVKIGCYNFFGVLSSVIQQIKIGDNIKLAAGSSLIRSPKDNELYIGVPAKIFKY